MTREYTNEELIKLMDTAPLEVQKLIESKSTVSTISTLGTRLGLKIDQIKKLAELNRNMLLGLVSPQECAHELGMVGIDFQTTEQIMSDLNQKIFLPLQQKMKGGGQPMVANKVPGGQSNAPVPNYSKPPMPAGQQPSRPPLPPQNTARPIASPPPNLPGAMPGSQMPNFERRLEDHEEPHIEIGGNRQAAVGSPPKILSSQGSFTPSRPPQPQIQRPPLPPPPMPQMQRAPLPPPPPPQMQRAPQSIAPIPPPPTYAVPLMQKQALPKPPMIEKYNSDPYRELPE